MTKKGYQPLKTKKTLKIIPPNMGSHVHMKKDGYTWEDLDRSYWKGFNTAKTNMEKRIAELEEQNKNLQIMLQAEREVTTNEDYLKKVTELENENEYAITIIKSLLDNSDEYARQRARDYLNEVEK